MKLIDVVQLTRDAIGNTMGVDYLPAIVEQETISNDELMNLPMQKLVDIGRAVTDDTVINSFSTGLIALLGKHVIEKRIYTSNLPSLYVDSFDWGGFLERTRVGLGEIMEDPMYNKVAGQSYADIEHTYYGQDVHSKIYGEAKAIMCPISIEKELIREAFYSWDKLNEFISAKMNKIKSTINLALAVYEKMLVASAIAISDEKTNSAIHLITEATNLGIIEQVNEGTEQAPDMRNKTYEEVYNDPNFLIYAMQRIKTVRNYFKEISTAFNDGTIPTWCDVDPNLILLDDFATSVEFNVKANTFNPETIGIGKFDKVVSWQAIKTSTSADFDRDAITSISISADADNKLGIGTGAYEKSGVIGLMFDPMAIGISLMRNKVTSSYTACADFWNEFNHQLVNYLVDSSYGMVAFIAD